jgi:hypothetical protein
MPDDIANTAPDPVAQAEARRDEAHHRVAAIEAGLAATKAALATHAPHAVVAAGRDILESAALHAEAERRAAFLASALDAARDAAKRATAEHATAAAEGQHLPRLRAAIRDRLASLADIHQHRAALAASESRYRESTDRLIAAFGLLSHMRPAWAGRGENLDLPMVPHDPRPRPQYRGLAEEISLWGALAR